jgi:hydroxymethylpyrimidine pyrophosphatase-like HAD family hydrolase
MFNQIDLTSKFKTSHRNYDIVFPKGKIVSPSPTTKYTYVMRADPDAVCRPIANALEETHRLDADHTYSVIEPHYNDFIFELSNIIGRTFSTLGKTEIHLYKQEEIGSYQKAFLERKKVISLDPLITGQNVLNLGISRNYLPGGVQELGMTNRPGTPPLAEQIQMIRNVLGSDPQAEIIEDDIYTGGSLIRVIDMLAEKYIVVSRIITGIQVGTPAKIVNRGIKILPAVKYEVSDDQKIDLGDPRDFMLGADGLVTYFGKEDYSRLPYIAPFVAPDARLSIPSNMVRLFSDDVLELNRKFFENIEQDLGTSIQLKHMNPHSTKALQSLLPCSVEDRVSDIAAHIQTNFEQVTDACLEAKDNTMIRLMDLPEKVAFIDVNGTILPSDSKDGHITDDQLMKFQVAVEDLRASGAEVGLNSDSPLPQLQEFAKRIGLDDCPIMAENGALLSYKGKVLPFRDLQDSEDIKQVSHYIALKRGIAQAEDVIAPEFGGVPLDPAKWAIGANRSSSISIFGAPEFLKELHEKITALYKNISCDFSPEHNFLGIHAGQNFRLGKAQSLEKLVNAGHTIYSIGDSLSDYAPMPLPNKVFFVSGNIPESIKKEAHVTMTRSSGLSGVIESLKQIQSSIVKKPQQDHTLRYEP